MLNLKMHDNCGKNEKQFFAFMGKEYPCNSKYIISKRFLVIFAGDA